MFYFSFNTIFFFNLTSSKLISLLISIKVTPFFISKYNTLISTLHGLGLCMAKGSLLSFLHFCIKKNEFNGSRSSPAQPIWVLMKEIKVWCIVLNFPSQQKYGKHLHLVIVIWRTSSSIYYIKDKTLTIKNINPCVNLCFKPIKKPLRIVEFNSKVSLFPYRPIKSSFKVRFKFI